MIRSFVVVSLALVPFPALAVTADDVLAEAAAFCASFENGVITVGPEVVGSVELTGSSPPETVIDYKGIECSTMASAWGGTGGTTLTILIDGLRFDHLAFDWSIADFGGPVLLLAQHGVNCGATGADRCVQALVWTAGKLTGPGEEIDLEEPASEDD